MATNPIIDTRDVKFVLFEMLEIQKLGEKFPKYADYDLETYEETLNLAERIAVDQVYPANAEGDKEGCHFNPDSKEVKIPSSYKKPLDSFYETGFIGISENPEIGGMGMPSAMGLAANEIFCTGSVPMLMYPGLSHGAMLLIQEFGTEEQREIYVNKMMSGEWGGTMCLTEADAGSDVGLGKSKAVKQEDGTYLITGQNIFISSGDNDYYDNMIHLKLARVEGDPDGTKGLSIFIVPKYRANQDCSIGEHNDVVCSGIEHKMGIKGSATCTMSFGDNNNCTGYLLGKERQGMKIMFNMMNEARIGVGIQGLALGSCAYMNAVTYSRNRVQGKHVAQMLSPEAQATTINNHPDVKRMLLWMKSHVEGSRMLAYLCGHLFGLEHETEGDEKKEICGFGELLRPIHKAGGTETGLLVTSEAIQVFGGYGYCSDYPVEQLMRDARIFPIYEGTTGIQAMDLTMRKLLMNPQQYNYNILKREINKTIKKAENVIDDKYISLVRRGITKLDEVIDLMKKQMDEGKFLHLFAGATPLLRTMHMLVLAWLHLWSLTKTLPKMKEIIGDLKEKERESFLKDNQEAAFYSGKVLSSQFYIGSEFPIFFGRIESLLGGESAVIKASDAIFSGAPLE